MTLPTPLHIPWSFRLPPGAANLKSPSPHSESSWRYEIQRPRPAPTSEVRDEVEALLRRTSQAKGHRQVLYSSLAYRIEAPERACCRRCRKFNWAAGTSSDFRPSF